MRRDGLCSRCEEAPRTRGGYCRPCANAIEQAYRRRKREGLILRVRHGAPDCSTPPPPPEGFRESDLVTGRPWA